MGENIYKLPSDMNLKIKTGTVGYNNKILLSDGKFSLGKNDQVNALELTKPKISHKVIQPLLIKTRNLKLSLTTRKKLLWYFFWQVVLQYGICFHKIQ